MPKAGCSLALIICPTSCSPPLSIMNLMEDKDCIQRVMHGHIYVFSICNITSPIITEPHASWYAFVFFSQNSPLQRAQAGPHPVSWVRGLWPPPTTEIKSCYLGLFFECADSHYKCSRHGLKGVLQQLHTESCGWFHPKIPFYNEKR